MAETLGWQRLLFLMSCAYTKAKHLELPCGLSIWPTPYLPEPDAPKQLWAKQHEWFIEEREAQLTPETCQPLWLEIWKSYEYAADINPAVEDDLSNDLYLTNMEKAPVVYSWLGNKIFNV